MIPKEIVAEKPKEADKPKIATVQKKVEKKADDAPAFSIETTKLEVDEKEMGIKNA